jgi:AAA domain
VSGDDLFPAPFGLVLTPISLVAAREIEYTDRPMCQASAFHLFVGRKGAGKGTTLADFAARVTRGELGAKRNVIWFASEDSNSIDIRPRLMAAGAELERVHVLTHGWLQLPAHIDWIHEQAFAIGDVGLVIIDPVANHIGGADSNADAHVRAAIAPLNDLADALACMVFGVRHLTEKECQRGVLGSILGASAWVQVPRVVLALVRDDSDPALAHFQCVAGNRMPPDTPGRLVRIEGHLLPGFKTEVTRAVWLGDSDKDVETLPSAPRKRPETKTDKARTILLDLLEAAPGMRMESDELDSRVAAATGLAAGTIRNLRTELGKAGAGLIRMEPERDEDETFTRWFAVRTNAPRSAALEPVHDSESGSGSGPVHDTPHPTHIRGELGYFTSDLDTSPHPVHLPGEWESGESENDSDRLFSDPSEDGGGEVPSPPHQQGLNNGLPADEEEIERLAALSREAQRPADGDIPWEQLGA